MVSTVLEKYEWQPEVTFGGSPVSGVKITAFDAADLEADAFPLTTGANGKFASPAAVLAADITLSGAPPPSNIDDKNPHDVRILPWLYQFQQFAKTFLAEQVDPPQTVVLATDTVLTQTNRTTVQGYTGYSATQGGTTLSAGTWDAQRLYDREKDFSIINPSAFQQLGRVTSVDGQNFVVQPDYFIETITFDALGTSWTGTWELYSSGAVTNGTFGDLLLTSPSPPATLTDVDATTISFDVAGTYTLNNCNVGTIFNNSGGNVTVNSNGTTIGANPNGITIVDAKTVKVTVIDNFTNSPLQDARVLLLANAGGTLPNQVSVSITRSGSTATVAHTGHGFSTGDKVYIAGVASTDSEYIGVKTITVTGPNAYTYTVSGSPTTPAPGSPTATAVVLTGLTDVNGEIERNDFNYAGSDQPVVGVARRQDDALPGDLYSQAVLGQSVTAAGYDQTARLLPDE